jgi:hypothetical protein
MEKEHELKPIGESLINRYEKKVETKYKTRLQELATPYESFINWQENTFDQDRPAFWMAVATCHRRNPEKQFLSRLEWIKSKNCLYPRQAIKVLLK